VIGIPIPYSDEETMRYEDSTTLIVENFVYNKRTVVDLSTLEMVVIDNETNEQISTDKLTWEPVVIGIIQMEKFYDAVFGGEEETGPECGAGDSGTYVCTYEGEQEVYSDAKVTYLNADGDVIE